MGILINQPVYWDRIRVIRAVHEAVAEDSDAVSNWC
jgi:hypothetical protein